MAWDFQVTNEVLSRMVEIIVREVNPLRVILFGSRGRGNARPDSDVDWLVVVESAGSTKENSHFRLMNRLYEAVAPFPVPSDFIIATPEEMEYWKNSINDIHAHALREGKILYERHHQSESIA